LKRDVPIVSDEIHSDLIMKGHTHIPTATLTDEIAENTVTLTSASKTFNLAGLSCSNIIIPERGLFDKFNNVCNSLWLGAPNLFGMVATESAYRYGEEWLGQLIDYIRKNHEFLVSYIQDNSPLIKVAPLEGTYLGWLDFSGLGLSDDEIVGLILREAKVWLDNGPKFGSGGEDFQRINLACPREILKQGLKRIMGATKKCISRQKSFITSKK
jgi:cystathionine beta-lyase